jgi:hypothetical protein
MANDAATYDYTTDPEFLQAKPDQQHAYLMANDPDYAKGTPEQQQAYRGHLSQHVPTEAEAGAVPPIAPLPQKPNTLRRSNFVEPEIEGTPIAPFGAAASIPRAVGGLVSGYGANKAADVLGVKNPWARDAITVGAGILGEGAGAAVEDTAGKIGFTPKTEVNTPIGTFKYHGGDQPPTGQGAPEPSRGEFEENQFNNLVGEGKAAKIPTRMPKPKAPAAPVDEVAQAVKNRTANWIPNKVTPPLERELPIQDRAHVEMNEDILKGRQERAAGRDVAHEDLAEARMRRGREQDKIDAGTATEGSNQKVLTVPEPNKPAPGENPNNQQSVKRRTTLVENAKRGKEGAGRQLNQIQGPVLFAPRGAGYSGVRERVPVGGEPPVSGGSEGTIGKGPIATKEFKSMPSEGENNRLAFHNQLEKDTGISVHDFVDTIQKKNPNMSRGDAYSLAENTLRDLNSQNSIEQQAAKARYQRLTGPEQRGPVRLGPEGRGIK